MNEFVSIFIKPTLLDRHAQGNRNDLIVDINHCQSWPLDERTTEDFEIPLPADRLLKWHDSEFKADRWLLYRRDERHALIWVGDAFQDRHSRLEEITDTAARKWFKRMGIPLPPVLGKVEPTTSGVLAKPADDPDAISKAIGIFSSDPSLSDREVCRRAGIKHPSTLTRSLRYQRVKETFAHDPPPTGTKDGNTRDVEAFD